MKNKILMLLMFLLMFIYMPCVNAQESFEINDVHVVEQSGTATIEDFSFDGNTINSNIVFNQVDDFVTLEIEMKNNTNSDYILSSIANQFNNDNIVVDSDSINKIIKGNDIQQFRVTLKYDNELINERERNIENTSLSFSFIDANPLVNPNTGNNSLLIILCLIFAVGLTIILYKKKKNLLLILLVLLIIPVFVNAEEIINFNINIHFNSLVVKGRMLHYTVTIDDGNGNVQTLDREYGTTVEDLVVPEKEGYDYDYWVDQNNQEVDNDSIVTSDMTITPHYTPIVYSISYNLNGGNASNNPTSYTIEDDITLNNPTKAGYTFQGWSDDGGETFQTSVHISGSTGNKNYVAYFSANQNTNYTVIHRQMNLNGNGYTEVERQTLQGATDTSVTPQTRTYTGFTSPSRQTKNINGDGSTTFTYDYTRNRYTFTISNRTYVNSNSTANGTYYYGTTITLSAMNRAGYSFRWSDNNTSRDRTFTLSSNTTLSAVYTANTNTPYTVIHKKMDLNGSTYTEANRQNLTGTTDTSVTPAVNTYDGFTSPPTQTVNIDGDGLRVVTYLYTRNRYTLTLEDSGYIETTFTSGQQYYYGKEITLKAKTRDGYNFSKWSNDSTSNPITFSITDNITMRPIYVRDTVDFATSSWDEIVNAYYTGDTDTLEDAMEAGTTRDVNMGTFGTHKLRIANLSTTDECMDTSISRSACGFVIEFADIITEHVMNTSITNVGGWPASEMSTYLNTNIYNALPNELKNVIIDTKVLSGHGSSDSSNFTSTDKLYLLSTKELGFDVSYDTAKSETRILDYHSTANNNDARIKKYNGSKTWWWIRSIVSLNNNGFLSVNTFGSWESNPSNVSIGVSPAFRIAAPQYKYVTRDCDGNYCINVVNRYREVMGQKVKDVISCSDEFYAKIVDMENEAYYLSYIHNKEALLNSLILPYNQLIYYCDTDFCLSGDTEVEVYDKKKKKRKKKKLRDITPDDLILCWDFDIGEFVFVEPLWIMAQSVSNRYYLLKFSDGSELKVIGDHRVFDVDRGEFINAGNENELVIGSHVFNSNGEIVELTSWETINEEIDAYNVITKYHMNLFANGILTSCNFSNIYPIKDMKYVVNNNEKIIADDLIGIDKKYIDGLRLEDVSVNYKGNKESTINYIREYVNRMINKEKH